MPENPVPPVMVVYFVPIHGPTVRAARVLRPLFFVIR